ncbi:DUF6624 domain-containing protein [uncultured Christiangramia sp.]|uniref:DUF6624 domain-containing protein n=1 Tax=Christiangramia sp. 3-2217-3z TaxID=3417564 RepID=UPI0026392076|nr:DUF6624 domain-containing protein [uncultured Christiangramia sp.]
MRYIISVILLLIITNISAQEINYDLKIKLDSIEEKDQELRKLFYPISNEEKKSILTKFGYTWEEFKEEGWEIVSKQDTINIHEVSNIIKQNGYPGNSLVGKPTNTVAWSVIQHSNKIEEYFPLIKKAGLEKEIPMTLVAMMEDRMLMYKGLPQKYGTQASGHEIKDPKTNETVWESFIWPIESPSAVNELRKEIGFKQSIEESAKDMDIDYKVLTLDYIKSLSTN